MQVKSSVKLNMARINELTQAAVTALEKTGEALHTEVIQAICRETLPLWITANLLRGRYHW